MSGFRKDASYARTSLKTRPDQTGRVRDASRLIETRPRRVPFDRDASETRLDQTGPPVWTGGPV